MATDTSGNQAVDFVWGNMPMQPDTGRGTALDKTKDSHNIAGYGYNGFPGTALGGVVVPSLTSMSTSAALTALQAAGLTRGTVTGPTGGIAFVQSAAAASRVALGTAVAITLGGIVPDLTGKTSAAASTALVAVGLVLGTVTGASGVVSAQGTAAATLVALGAAVTITIA